MRKINKVMMRVTTISGGNPVAMRSLNRALVIETIRRNGPLSRSDIANVTNLSRTAMTNLINQLLEEGTLWEKGVTTAGRGRGKALLELNKGSGSAIGLEFADGKIDGVLVNLKGDVISSYKTECSGNSTTEETIDILVKSIERLIDDSTMGRESIKGIGIGIQGLVDHKEGVSFSVPFFENWKDVQLKKILEDRIHIPVIIDCRIFAATQAEIWYGAGREIKDFLYVGIGTGVALGIVSDGKVLRGVSNSAGQFGHTIVADAGKRCFCGNYGCLETVVSTRAVRERAIEALSSGVESSMREVNNVTFKEIVKAANAGDKLAITLLEETGEYLGIGIANLINLLNPGLIVIGGEIIQGGSIILDSIKRSSRPKSVNVCFRSANVRFSALDQESAPLGAAAIVLHKYFEVPEIVVHRVKGGKSY